MQESQDLILDGDIERGGRLVCQHQARLAGQRQGDHRPLQHAAGPMMRIVVEPALCGRDADPVEQSDGGAASRPAFELSMEAHRLDQLVADRPHRIEAAHRALEHHGDAAPAKPTLVLGSHAT